MAQHQVVKRNGRRFVVVEESEWKRVQRLAARASHEDTLPVYPPADQHGNRPATEYALVSIARKVIHARKAAGLSQRELATLAGVRQETVSRLESGKHSPTVRTVDKIEAALRKAMAKGKRASRSAKNN